MQPKIIHEKQDMRYLKWSHARNSSGTAGSFLKSESTLSGVKTYYKLSNYDSEKGIIGHECINEIIVDRLLSILGVEHLEYQLVHSVIEVDGKEIETYICASKDFKRKGETKCALDDYYQINKEVNETHFEFCVRKGWREYINEMLVVDYLILNRDRHGANIEVLRNSKHKTARLAPLFDHGLSLLYSCYSEEDINDFDVLKDKPCQCFVGSRSTVDNLALVEEKKTVFKNVLKIEDKERLFEGLDGIISPNHIDKIWSMIWQRWCYYENLCNTR